VHFKIRHNLTIVKKVLHSRRQGDFLPVKYGWLVHVNPDAVKWACHFKTIESKLKSPKVPCRLVKKVEPDRQTRPALALESVSILTSYKDA
jgi:hypothetical protein